MFARVMTAQAGAGGLDDLVRLAREQLPGARERPGFQGWYVLTDDTTGKVITISLWETREQMEAVGEGTAAGIHEQGMQAAGIIAARLETYAVALRA